LNTINIRRKIVTKNTRTPISIPKLLGEPDDALDELFATFEKAFLLFTFLKILELVKEEFIEFTALFIPPNVAVPILFTAATAPRAVSPTELAALSVVCPILFTAPKVEFTAVDIVLITGEFIADFVRVFDAWAKLLNGPAKLFIPTYY
jgi:hypothetical protein